MGGTMNNESTTEKISQKNKMDKNFLKEASSE